MLFLRKKTFIIAILCFILISYHFVVWKSISPNTLNISLFANLKIHKIASIESNDTIEEKYDIFYDIFKDKNIILLGESTHSDETTFAIKNEMIEYLHKKMGFSIIAFESGRFEAEYFSMHLDSTYFDKSLWPFWAESPYSNKLLEYIQYSQKTSLPIHIEGFDIQPSGNLPIKERVEIVDNYLKKKGSSLNNFPIIESSVKNLQSGIFWKMLSLKDTEIMNHAINQLVKLCESTPFTQQDTIFMNYFRNLNNYAKYQKMIWESNERFQYRDSLMANSFFDIYDNKYKNKKIIIWLSNFHALYNNSQYKSNVAFLKFRTFGEYLKRKYKNKMYALCFTSFCTKNKSNMIYDQATPSSMEYQLHKLNYNCAFINFENNNSIKTQHFLMRTNQNLILDANWGKMCDGIFYIDTILQNKNEYN